MAFDALVLLGCRVGPKLSGAAARRVERARGAFLEGLAPRIVVTGGRAWQGLIEADAMAGALEAGGVPRSAMVLERASRTTRENAELTARLLGDGARSVAVVTCDWHLPRALDCFRRAGFSPVGLGAPSPPMPAGRRFLLLLRERGAWILERAVARG